MNCNIISSIDNRKLPSFWQQVWGGFLTNQFAMLGLFILFIIIALALFGSYFSPYTYYEINFNEKNLEPSLSHWFGTDDLGRDMFTRVCQGARISLFVGLAAAFIDMIVGTFWGGISALSGGKVDEIMMRFADIISIIPSLLIIIALMMAIGSGLHTIIIALSIFGWITMARVVRGQLLVTKQQPFILASKGLGANYWRILFVHLLPQALGPIIVTLTFSIPSAIFTEAFLSYLGLGVQAPVASLGTMASEGLPAMEYYPWRVFFPAGFISLTIIAFNLIGEGLKRAFAFPRGLDYKN